MYFLNNIQAFSRPKLPHFFIYFLNNRNKNYLFFFKFIFLQFYNIINFIYLDNLFLNIGINKEF
jgi:hypothetical protein